MSADKIEGMSMCSCRFGLYPHLDYGYNHRQQSHISGDLQFGAGRNHEHWQGGQLGK